MSPPPEYGPALVFGCGYLGRHVADRWKAEGRRVVVLTRGRAAELAAAGFEPIVGDVTDPASLRGLPAASTVLYAVGLDRAAGKPMYDVYFLGLANVLDALPRPGRFIYVSSTSVYGQTDGSEVDERSPTEPVEPSGRIIREAERLLASRLPYDAVVLRFAGLYGPGRLLREKAIRAGEPLVGDADRWLNLVHVEDGAAAVLAAEQAPRGSLFNVSDGHPVRRRDFYTHLAELLGAPAAAFAPGEPTAHEPNRRVVSRAGLPWRPAFPDYRSGLAASRPPPAAVPPAPAARPAG